MSEHKEPSSVRLAGSLAIAGLLSGLLLVGVFLATKPRIQRNRAEALREAIYKVLPGTTDIEAFKLSGQALTRFEGDPGCADQGDPGLSREERPGARPWAGPYRHLDRVSRTTSC